MKLLLKAYLTEILLAWFWSNFSPKNEICLVLFNFHFFSESKQTQILFDIKKKYICIFRQHNDETMPLWKIQTFTNLLCAMHYVYTISLVILNFDWNAFMPQSSLMGSEFSTFHLETYKSLMGPFKHFNRKHLASVRSFRTRVCQNASATIYYYFNQSKSSFAGLLFCDWLK